MLLFGNPAYVIKISVWGGVRQQLCLMTSCTVTATDYAQINKISKAAKFEYELTKVY